MWACHTARSEPFPSMRRASYPGVPFSTRKPLTWPSAVSRAQTTTTSAMVPLPIHFFSPLISQVSPSRRAEVSRPTESEPWVGSVRANAPRVVQLRHRGQPPLLLLLRAEHRDGLHGQSGLDAEEGAQAAVAAVELEVDQAVGDRAHRRAAVALDPVAHDPEAPQPLDQVTRELRALPVVVDDRQHLVVDEAPGAVPVVALLRGELVGDPEEVGAARTANSVESGVEHGGPAFQLSKT